MAEKAEKPRTTQRGVRVPIPLKPLVVALIYAWRNRLDRILDPKGEKLVSQVENAIATILPEIKSVNEFNLSPKPVNNLARAPNSGGALQQENAQLLKRLETAERLIGRRLLEMALREEQTQKKQEMAIAKLASENSSLRQQLEDLAVKASFWASRAQAAEAQLELLSQQQQSVEALKAE